MILHEAILRWLTYRQRLAGLGQVKPSTLLNQRKIAQGWIDRLGHVELRELRKSHVDVAAAELAQTRAPVTVQADVALLAQFLNWCVDEGLLEQRPRLPAISVPAEDYDLPSDEAFVWVLQNVPKRIGGALEFMLLTGLAPHELERLQPGDYSSERKAVGIGYREDFAVKTASRRRWVPVNLRALTLWLPPFPSVEAMAKAIQRARRPDMPPGAEQVTPKMMRKWFASHIAGTDTPEHILQRLLGHSVGSKITRKHYVRSSAADVAGAVDSLALKKG